MLINSPSNPTGQTFSAAALLEITKFCKEHNITLISDEIYADLTFNDENQTTPCTKENFNRGPMIMTGGMSKVRSSVFLESQTEIDAHMFLDILRRWLANRLCHLP